MKTIVFAYHNIGYTGLKTLIERDFEISAVITHEDDQQENIWFDSVAELAANHNIPVYAPQDINHPLWVKRLRELEPEIIFSFYYRNLISREILDLAPAGGLNLHGSLLPCYRGRCPVNWVLVNGETETGVTLHQMTEKPDAGAIAGQKKVVIEDRDTALSLHHKMTETAAQLLNEVLPGIKSGKLETIPQDNTFASYFGGRGPADGEIDWQLPATRIHNLVRAVTRPYPGAFSHLGNRKCLFWQVEVTKQNSEAAAGTVITCDPLVIACGKDALTIKFGQTADGIYMSGTQLAQELNLVAGMRFYNPAKMIFEKKPKKRVLILGVNGFIGNHLSEKLLESGSYEVYGMDLRANTISHLLNNPDFHFKEGDISIMHEWIEYHVRKCDIILPLVAIATPIEYVRNPLRVFELDFEENLRIVRYCAKYNKRLIFPSTSEVYGMCQDDEFNEHESHLVLGPIHKQRWIYSCSKQMLDRVIWAYGSTRGLQFSLFRPFNWVGPKLDSLNSARIGSSRVITQFILNLVEGTPIRLVDGGSQKRCFTDIKDGIGCLFQIIENPKGLCDSQIFNIGNPEHEYSMRELAEVLMERFAAHPLRSHFPPSAGIQEIEAKAFYGPGYQDVQHRRPSIEQARKRLGWTPQVTFADSVAQTLDYFLQDLIQKQADR